MPIFIYKYLLFVRIMKAHSIAQVRRLATQPPPAMWRFCTLLWIATLRQEIAAKGQVKPAKRWLPAGEKTAARNAEW
jgi:hypothetical protein